MSIFTPVIPPREHDKALGANAPDPESERADKLKAEKMKRVMDADPLTHVPEDEFPENAIAREQSIAKQRLSDD